MADIIDIQDIIVFRSACEVLDEVGTNYEKQEDELSATYLMKYDDGMDAVYSVYVSKDDNTLQVYAYFDEVKDKACEDAMVLAINDVNNNIVEGCFEYDFSDSAYTYRNSICFNGCTVSKEMIVHTLRYSYYVVGKYEERLGKIARGEMSYDEFVSTLADDED